MTVYFAQARVDLSTVKIGFTSDLAKRQQNMSVSTPGGMTILATLPGSRETEEYLHEMFAEDRLNGEWFRFSEPVRQFVLDIRNGKQGLIPFKDEAIYKRHSPEEFSAEALDRAKSMAADIINAEYRGFRDTIGAAKYRIEKKYGFRASMMHRLLYRELRDVTAGVFLHLQDIHEQICAKRGSAAFDRLSKPTDEADQGRASARERVGAARD